MRVYRVELQADAMTGPFCLSSLADFCDYHENLPSPYEEGLWPEEDEVCGCESLDKLRVWFTPEMIRPLERDGFEVVELEVPDVQVQLGTYQVTFPRHLAEKVEAHQPSNILTDQLPLRLAS